MTGEIERVALVLLRARRNDEVEEELTREARRGLGEHLLERSPFAVPAVSLQGLVSL